MMLLVCVASILSVLGLMATSSAQKGSKKTPEKKGSPKRKDLTKIKFSEDALNQKRKPAYYLKIIKLRPDFELIYIESTPGNDGYGQKLFDRIKDDGYRDDGVLMVVRRRVSQADNSVLNNARDRFARRAIVRIVTNSTPESRLEILNKFKAFLNLPENNKYGYDYIVNETSDLTPLDTDNLEPLDHYVQNDMIVNIIVNIYENADQTWYRNNTESALDFFSGPTFPQWASDQLGYPTEPHHENAAGHPI
jgi:hypothetical protein